MNILLRRSINSNISRRLLLAGGGGGGGGHQPWSCWPTINEPSFKRRQCTHRSYNSSTFKASSPSSSAFIRSAKDEQVMRDLFLSFATQNDNNGSNDAPPSLNVDNLRDLLLAIGDHPSDSKLSKLIKAVDIDNNGQIEYDEFVAGCESILSNNQDTTTSEDASVMNIDNLIDIFHTLDADGSGDLTKDELSNLLSAAGVSLSHDDANEIMYAADANNDGKISLEEFIALMTDPTKKQYSWRIRSGFRVCLIMGGPGSGKGTLCEKLVEHAHLRHYSSGEMLRDEIASGSPLAKSIEQAMKKGELVSSSTIIALIKKQLRRFPGSLLALDGFPRNKSNYLDFDEVLGTPEFAIVVDVPDEEMLSRIMKRSMTSGRADDNLETAKLRLKTFHEQTEPTMEQLELNKVPIYRLDGTQTPDEIWNELMKICPQIGTRVNKNFRASQDRV